MMVTQDKYELPLAVADSVEELARITGAKTNNIYSALSHQKNRSIGKANKGRLSKYKEVIVDD